MPVQDDWRDRQNAQGKRVIDAFLDLVVEENLETRSCRARTTSTMRR